MKNKETDIVKFINKHLEDNNKFIIKFLNDYLHSSHTYRKQNWDKTYLEIQPSWPEYTVINYKCYYDPICRGNHKANRIIVYFEHNTEYDISLYKFKKFCKNHKKQYEKCIVGCINMGFCNKNKECFTIYKNTFTIN